MSVRVPSEASKPRRSSTLAPAQELGMVALERRDPEAKVLGWHEPSQGPLLALSDGTWAVMTRRGRLRAVAQA